MIWRRVAVAGALMAATAMCGCPPHNGNPVPSGDRYYTYTVVNTYPHDTGAFTQGLVYEEGVFYEGTGLHGRSSLRRVEPETGTVLAQHGLATEYFGEGIVVFGDRIVQLTWQNRIGFVYNKADFALLDTFSYTGEGWGITQDGTRLIMSDGTAELRFLDPETLEETGRVTVHDESGPVIRLNELEFIQGEVFANVWLKDYILRIDPGTGEVVGSIDCSGLLSPAEEGPADVLNGIAYDAETGRIWVTGKLWPKVFEIALVPVEPETE